MQTLPLKPVSENLLSGLNDSQLAAVKHEFTSHCLVLAGAGSGKTTVLTRRIAYCAATYCDPSRILALTFTRKAADEMRSRVHALLRAETEAGRPLIGTFHGFGLHVLRDTVDGVQIFHRLGYSEQPSLMSDKERLEALAGLSTAPERRELGVDLARLDDLLACLAVNPRKLDSLPAVSLALLREHARRFALYKKERNQWEFSDMIGRALDLFTMFPDVAQHYARHFRHVLVDEFQDTNPLQIRLLQNILAGKSAMFAVGDDDQAIYAFRGADTGPILNFARHFAEATVYKLELNYRSTPAILAAANGIFRDKSAPLRKVLRSGRYAPTRKERGAKPRCRRFADHDAMIAWALGKMRSIEAEAGIPAGEMALLFRVNESLDQAREALDKRVGPGRKKPALLTVHGSKGLEFPVVFLCDLEESRFPNYRVRRREQIRAWSDFFRRLASGMRRQTVECDLDEEKRLFYVGVTRAQRQLYFLSVRKQKRYGRMVALAPSRFLKLVIWNPPTLR